MKTQLEVGDKIYRIDRTKIVAVLEITRVTKTMAFTANDTRFRKDISNYGTVTWIDKPKWNFESYSIETPELIERANREKLIEEIIKQCESIIKLMPKTKAKISELEVIKASLGSVTNLEKVEQGL